MSNTFNEEMSLVTKNNIKRNGWLLQRLESTSDRADSIARLVRVLFLLAVMPALMLSIATGIAEYTTKPFHLNPITRDIKNSRTFNINGPTFSYNTALIEASHMALLAQRGESVKAYTRTLSRWALTFTQDTQWLQSHPNQWYTYSGGIIPKNSKYHIGNPDLYIARMDNAMHVTYSKSVRSAVLREMGNAKEITTVFRISSVYVLLSLLIEAILLFYAHTERHRVGVVRLEIDRLIDRRAGKLRVGMQ